MNQARVGVPACRPDLQACDRKAGLELTPQLWLRTQEGSVVMSVPDPANNPECRRVGRGDTGISQVSSVMP